LIRFSLAFQLNQSFLRRHPSKISQTISNNHITEGLNGFKSGFCNKAAKLGQGKQLSDTLIEEAVRELLLVSYKTAVPFVAATRCRNPHTSMLEPRI
jgi:hypothetical protein